MYGLTEAVAGLPPRFLSSCRTFSVAADARWAGRQHMAEPGFHHALGRCAIELRFVWDLLAGLCLYCFPLACEFLIMWPSYFRQFQCLATIFGAFHNISLPAWECMEWPTSITYAMIFVFGYFATCFLVGSDPKPACGLAMSCLGHCSLTLLGLYFYCCLLA